MSNPIRAQIDVTNFLAIRWWMRLYPGLLATMTTLMFLAFLFTPTVGWGGSTTREMLTLWVGIMLMCLGLLWIVVGVYRDRIARVAISILLIVPLAREGWIERDTDDSYVMWFILIGLGLAYLLLLLFFRRHRLYRHLVRWPRSSPLERARRAGLLLPRARTQWLRFLARSAGALCGYFGVVSLIVVAAFSLLGTHDFPLPMLPIVWFFSLLVTRGWGMRPVLRWYHEVRRRIAPTATELATLDARPLTLFLRSFKSDAVTVKSRFRAFRFFFDVSRSRAERLEEVIADELFNRGPIIAVADPAAALPPLGAARENLSGEQWREYVMRHVSLARCVACILGDTEHLGWELAQIRSQGAVDKTLVIVPPPPHEPGMSRNLERLMPSLRDGSGDMSTDSLLPEHSRVLVHSPRHDGFVNILCRQQSALAYAEVVRLGLALQEPRG